ncbi:unnamed protein product [Clonostachys rosea]|uniref:Heterokaryon incompatibility domain-containing protein n=1 Tax=Bionectria ochroleuca TaxID=29856 RepID=A0ABY6U4U0_BIOOC|nr:unnamed protein product [Clonostachys rosea]
MPIYGFTAPLAEGESGLGTYSRPVIPGVAEDEIDRAESMPLWSCTSCSGQFAAKFSAFVCRNVDHDGGYIICRGCHEAGARCDPSHEIHEAQFYLEWNIRYFYDRTKIGKRQIRVLRIRAASCFDDPLDGLVTVMPVDEPLEYNTLSYVWGSYDKTKLIKIGHCLVPITANLDLALRRFRAQNNTNGVIWTDAICINQADMVEKAAQITMMRDIYKNSQMTYIYVGEHEQDVRVDLFAKQITSNQLGTDEETRLAGIAVQALMNQAWFSRTWVIQEVAASAQSIVMFGDTTIDFKLLRDRLNLTTGTASMHDDPFITSLGQIRQTKLIGRNFKPAHMANARRFWLEKQFGNRPEKQEQFKKIQEYFDANFKPFPYPLLDLLESFRNRESTDPRDKIYALLGLATDITYTHDGEAAEIKGLQNTDPPQPDYSKTVSDVYYEYACFFIESGQWCDVLHSAALNRLGSTRLADLPSWVPDWTSSRPSVQSKRFNELFGQYLYHAGGLGGEAQAHVDRDTKALSINAAIIDSVAYISEPWTLGEPREASIMQTLDALITNSAYCRKGQNEGSVPFTIRDAILHNAINLVTECEDCVEDVSLWLQCIAVAMTFKYTRFSLDIADESRSQYFELSNHSWQMFREGQMDKLRDPVEQAFQNLFDPEPFLDGPEVKLLPDREYLHEVIAHRRFCITENGRIGLVPLHAEVADVICIVRGGTTPYVLRADEEDWIYIGDSYVRGVMRGEMLQSEDFEDMRLFLK